jgi:hypothetical protein
MQGETLLRPNWVRSSSAERNELHELRGGNDLHALAKVRARHLLAFLVLWIVLVLYPNPYRLAISLARVLRPPVDAAAVTHLAAALPDDPVQLELFVLREWPYQFDWQTYNVPWYFPTAPQALAKRTGDCKTRFVVLASLLEAKGIPYRQRVSLSHIWVNYRDKPTSSIEQDQFAWLMRDENGTSLRIPREDLAAVWDAAREAFWDYMPPERKILLLAGMPVTIVLGWAAHSAREVSGARVRGRRE